jgi:outer membrane protein assembly factor BamB
MKSCVLLTVALDLALSTRDARAQTDWNQWRGPHRDGKVANFKAPAAWPKELTRKWKVEVGVGHSSPLIVGDAIYLHSREGEDEVIRRLALATGKEVWKDTYPAPYEMNPAARGHGKGPKSTPVYSDGRLYTFGISGILSSLDATTGNVVWRKEFSKEYKATSPLFGTAMSPLVDNGLLIAHVGGNDDGALTAFDAKTGDVRWKWTGDGPAYASPVIVNVGGTRQVVTQTQKMVVGVDETNGKLLWSLPFTTPYSQNSVTPVAAGDLIVFAGLQQPTFAVRVKKSGDTWTAEKAWETRDAIQYMNTAVLDGGKLYGMSSKQRGQMFALDAATGKMLWSDEGRVGDNAAVLDAGPVLLALTTTAEMRVYKKGESLTEVARYTVAESPTWATPAVQGNKIVVKDLNSLIVYELPT